MRPLSLKQINSNWVVLLLYAQVQARNKNISNYLKFGKRSRIIINIIPSTHERPAFKHYIQIFVLLLDTIPEYLGQAQGNEVKVNNGKNILFKEMHLAITLEKTTGEP